MKAKKSFVKILRAAKQKYLQEGKGMLGSIPCYPGYKQIPGYNNNYFYCDLCNSIVSPTNVDIAIVSPDQPTANPKTKLSVLRCKNHPTKGLKSGGPITSLQGLIPSSSVFSSGTHQKMLQLCARVRCLDIVTLCSMLIATLLAVAGAIIQFVIAAPIASFIPFVLLGVSVSLCLASFLCARLSKKNTLRWQELSKEIVLSSLSVPVQSGTECYTLLTEFPPTCYETPKRIDDLPYSVRTCPRRAPRVIVKKTACKLSTHTQNLKKAT